MSAVLNTAHLVTAYQSGMTLRQLADAFGTSRETVRGILIKHGCKMRSRGLPKVAGGRATIMLRPDQWDRISAMVPQRKVSAWIRQAIDERLRSGA